MVNPGTQMVEAMLPWVTSGLMAPGWNAGLGRDGGWLLTLLAVQQRE